MVKRIFLLALIMCFMVSVSVFASVDLVSYLNFTSFNKGSYTHGGLGINFQERFAIMGSYNNISTFIGDFTAYDLVGGFKFKYTPPLLSDYPVDNTIMGGVRFGGDRTGFLIQSLSRRDYTEKWFGSSNGEFVIWPNGVTGLRSNFMVGYQIVDEFAIKGGLNFLNSSEGGIVWGLSVGIESKF